MSNSESEGSDSSQPLESIISTRARRSNAGKRMKALLAEAEKEDSDNEIFKEVENDGEFDLDAVKHTVEQAGDSDFSSNSDLSEDEEDSDEGERQLMRQQRQDRKEQRRKDREKMFKIKTPAAPKPKKKKPERTAEDTIEILMAQTRRSSQRSSAINNRQQTIERLLENERKRSEYTSAPVRKKAKLTQAQRLAEAKLTEQKNTASLHSFLEVEEERKQAQRLALLNKRAKLKNVIRWVSASVLRPVQPVPVPAPQGQLHSNPDNTSTENTNAENTNAEVKPEEEEEQPPLQGPEQIYNFSALSLERFAHNHTKLATRTTILGERNVTAPPFPPRRLCPITNQIAKYVDPQSGLAYLNISIYRLYKRIANHEYVWNCAAGGVYTQPWVTERHAKGVPPGFADVSELPPAPEGLVTDEQKWQEYQEKERIRQEKAAQSPTPQPPNAPEAQPQPTQAQPTQAQPTQAQAEPAQPAAAEPAKVKNEN